MVGGGLVGGKGRRMLLMGMMRMGVVIIMIKGEGTCTVVTRVVVAVVVTIVG